ncbi:MAG: dTDP-4-dehydrorhamnose reductase [Gammaproteobacteria bacterium]|nr:dTDP-4-dehydrorhamnose reductase [Gammaproteobacteria bacterium]
MKVLITGAGGQVGCELLACAPAAWQISARNHAELDLANPAQLAAAIEGEQPQLVINAAGYTLVDRAETEPELAQEVNAEAPARLAELCGRDGIKLIHISTDFVFDGRGCRPYQTGDPTNPLGQYGASKLAGEHAVLDGLPGALVLRTAWVYSVHGSNFVKTMLRSMAQHDAVRVVCDQIGTPTWARALAQAIWRAAERNLSGIHHWTDAGVASWYDFAVAIAEEGRTLGLLEQLPTVEPISSSDYPTPAQRPHFAVLDKQETWRALELQPPHWRVQLRTMLRDFKDRPDA